MWEPQSLTTLWASTACYRDTFFFYIFPSCPCDFLRGDWKINILLNVFHLIVIPDEWGRKVVLIGYWWESQKERDHWRDSMRLDVIKMDLREIRWGNMDWIDLAQDRDQWRAPVNTVMNLRVPWNAEKFLSSCRIGGSSRRAQLHE
jgi:hypothetical protein